MRVSQLSKLLSDLTNVLTKSWHTEETKLTVQKEKKDMEKNFPFSTCWLLGKRSKSKLNIIYQPALSHICPPSKFSHNHPQLLFLSFGFFFFFFVSWRRIFGEFWWINPHQRNVFFFSGDQLVHTNSTLSASQDQSTVDQRSETTAAEHFLTSCMWGRFPDGFPHYSWTA